MKRNLLEAWEIIEERWGGTFDADNWTIRLLNSVGNDNGETIIYGKNIGEIIWYNIEKKEELCKKKAHERGIAYLETIDFEPERLKKQIQEFCFLCKGLKFIVTFPLLYLEIGDFF